MKKLNFLIALLTTIFSATHCYAQTAEKTLSVSGLKESVTVRRDGRWIPYIEAKSDDDLYFAQGFATASDRLWQMELLRRVSRGELAEIFGRQVLEEDKMWRKFGFAKIADESLAILNPQLRRALESYAKGVNAYIATLNKETMPVEFQILQIAPRQWTPQDTIIIGKILAEALSSTWRNDIARASISSLPPEKLNDLLNRVTPFDVILFGKDSVASISNLPSNELFDLKKADELAEIRKSSLEKIGFYMEDLAASNNWVISGKRTANGKAILANDPHLPANAPGIWYLSHLSTPDMRVSGVTFPGVPGIVLGHNEFIAWGATNVGPDVQDLYLEEFNADGKYKTPNGFAEPTIRREEIKVRINPQKPETETVVLEVTETRNGVIFFEEGKKKYALRWTARKKENQEFEAFIKLNRARNWKDFQNALRTYGGASQNFVYADTKGNIGWQIAGKIPIRKTGSGAVPYNGATDEGAWIGDIPFNELPFLYNPPQGFIVTANQRIVGTNYKYFDVLTRDAATPWRARRIYELLKNDNKVTIEKVRDVQHDIYNLPFQKFGQEIARLYKGNEEFELIKNWDGNMSPDSKEAVLINEIRNCVAQKIADENKPVPANMVRERLLHWIIRENSLRWLPRNFANYSDLIKFCDAEARETLAKPNRLGPDKAKWIWGNVFVANFQHPLAAAPLIGGQFRVRFNNVGGSGQTPNVGSFVSMRHISSPGNWDDTHFVIPLGQSGNPQSPYWKDQFEAWRTGTIMKFPFTKTAVESAAKEILVLE